MQYKDSNNDFFSYQGTISRKNYTINLLILTALFIVISLVRFESFMQFTNLTFLYSIILFMVSLFKFVILMSAISVIYRRIADISYTKQISFYNNMKKIFVLLFVFPVLYIFCLRFFIDIIPVFQNLLDMLVFYILIPFGVLAVIILCFIKGK